MKARRVEIEDKTHIAMPYNNQYYNFTYPLHDKDTQTTSIKSFTTDQYTVTENQTLHDLRSVYGFHPRIGQLVGGFTLV